MPISMKPVTERHEVTFNPSWSAVPMVRASLCTKIAMTLFLERLLERTQKNNVGVVIHWPQTEVGRI